MRYRHSLVTSVTWDHVFVSNSATLNLSWEEKQHQI